MLWSNLRMSSEQFSVSLIVANRLLVADTQQQNAASRRLLRSGQLQR